MKKIYVGNFPYNASEEQLKELFEQHGTVHSFDLIKDRDTGRSRGFAFVQMDDAEAAAAIAALNGMDMDGRALRVNEAQPRESGGGRGSRGRRGGGGGGRNRY